MYPCVIEVDGKGYDSVYAFIKEYGIVMHPVTFYTTYLAGYDPGDVVRVVTRKYSHFRGCNDCDTIVVLIKILETI